MTKEIVISFLLALIVVGGSLFAFAKYGGFGPLPGPQPRTQASGSSASAAITRPADPCLGGKMLQGECHVPAPGKPGMWIRQSDLYRRPMHPESTMNVASGEITEHERQRVAQFEAQQRADVAARQAQMQQAFAQDTNDHAQCAEIDKAIHAIDVRTRAPLSAGEQDYWRNERKSLQDRKFNLRC